MVQFYKNIKQFKLAFSCALQEKASFILFKIILIVGIICYMIVLWKKREEINYWGRHIFILFAWGEYICIEAATRDNFHSNKQDIFDCIIKKMEEEQIKKYEELKVPQGDMTQMAKAYQKHLAGGVIDYLSKLFEEMIKVGVFKENDPYQLALEFYSPIYMLISIYDVSESKEDVVNIVKFFNPLKKLMDLMKDLKSLR